MSTKIIKDLREQFTKLKEEGLYKQEQVIVEPQAAEIKVSTGEEVLNFCANNYLGLSSHPAVIEAAHSRSTKSWKKKFLHSCTLKIRSSMLPVLTPTAVFLNPCLEKIAPLFLTN